MKYAELRTISKPYFGYEELAQALGVGLASAKVSANRYVRGKFLLRLKRNLYVFNERWRTLEREDSIT